MDWAYYLGQSYYINRQRLFQQKSAAKSKRKRSCH